MDACIMDGQSMKVGSVTAVQDIFHPITLARKVLEKTNYNFLGAKGAMDLAKSEGFTFLKPGDLVTDYARESLNRWKQSHAINPTVKPDVSLKLLKYFNPKLNLNGT
jgi:N4-(beta-N-acetylglucosaminyl)-L-asparaginase